MESEYHFVKRGGWLRASVTGANDGILSTTSRAIGVAVPCVAGVVTGALSMAAGEYVSVSSQSDVETADLKREYNELASTPDIELNELSEIYETRGFSSELVIEVAKQLTAFNSLAAKAGVSKIGKSVLRISTLGTIAMVMSALIGYLFGVGMK